MIERVNGMFWTREDEMIEDLEDIGFVVDDVCGEYVVVVDDEENTFILYLGHANSTMWVERIREY